MPVESLAVQTLRQVDPTGVGTDAKGSGALQAIAESSVVTRVQIDRCYLKNL